MPANANTVSARLNHTMIRVADKEKSLHFYLELLGMEVIDEYDGGDFTLLWLGYQHPSQKGLGRGEREGLLELTYNHPKEGEPLPKYVSGNEEGSRGFGHIAISVDNVDAFCDYLLEKGVEFKKKPNEGRMKGIAFAYDPDGYWVEIVATKKGKY